MSAGLDLDETAMMSYKDKRGLLIQLLSLLQPILAGDQWWPFFCNILFSCNRHIVLSDSIFWFNKLGVNVGILLLYVFKQTIVCARDRSVKWVIKKHKIMKSAYQWWPSLLP